MTRIAIYTAGVTLALSAVAIADGPKFASTWKSPEASNVSFAGKKVAALIISDDQGLRVSGEEALVRELAGIGLLDPDAVVGGVRIHVPRAYPMYDSGYAEAVAVLRDYVAGFENLVTFGRNGLHRYNNQDHSMWTAVLASLNLLDGADYDVWSVNSEAEYLEEGGAVEGALFEELAGEAAA